MDKNELDGVWVGLYPCVSVYLMYPRVTVPSGKGMSFQCIRVSKREIGNLPDPYPFALCHTDT